VETSGEMARPSKYNESIQQKADSYLHGTYKAVDPDTGKETAQPLYCEDGSVIPSIEGLAEWLKVNRSTVYQWQTDDKSCEIDGQIVRFSDTLDQILSVQKRLTLNNGLKGLFNSNIAKLVLANHGMHDKVDSQTNVNVSLGSDVKKL
jgi:hypothetical protein